MKKQKTTKFILGAGVAGLILAYFLDDYYIISKNLLGQLDSNFILGPRILQKDKDITVLNLLSEIRSDNSKEEIKRVGNCVLVEEKIGYKSSDAVKNNLTENFKKNYSLITRGKLEYEKSFLSDGKNIIEHFVYEHLGKNTFNYVFKKIAEKLISQNRIIFHDAIAVYPDRNSIHLDNFEKYVYTDLISTIPLNKLIELTRESGMLKKYDFNLSPKNFYLCENSSKRDIKLSKKFMYVYSIEDCWTRKTYFEDKIIYESQDSITEDLIDKNKILGRAENKKFQIMNSINMKEFLGIKLAGRYAQWSHKIKTNDIIQQALELKEENNAKT